MAEPYLGEIRMFAGNFAPVHWALCDGSLLPISNNDALYSLLGTTYGGDGQTTFALPDMRGRVPMHQGTGVGLTTRITGQYFGLETVTLGEHEIPSHNHRLNASMDVATSKNPQDHVLAQATTNFYDKTAVQTPVNLFNSTVSNTGGGYSHENMQAYLCVNFIICLAGIYPNRN